MHDDEPAVGAMLPAGQLRQVDEFVAPIVTENDPGLPACPRHDQGFRCFKRHKHATQLEMPDATDE